MNYQWYPGHMMKAKRMMQENMRLVDLVIELLDARIPESSQNPDIDALAQGKARIKILTKADLADNAVNKQWLSFWKKQGVYALSLDARTGACKKPVGALVDEACRAKRERDAKRGIKNRPVRAMVAGIPNVGKSTFINSFAGKACTKTGNKPGVTKGKQWIRLSDNLELLDTPGILWPKFESQEVGRHLALVGSMNDEIVDKTELAVELLSFLRENYPQYLAERYALSSVEDAPAELLTTICMQRKCLKSGGEADIDRGAALLLDDFRSGRLGRISLERPSV